MNCRVGLREMRLRSPHRLSRGKHSARFRRDFPPLGPEWQKKSSWSFRVSLRKLLPNATFRVKLETNMNHRSHCGRMRKNRIRVLAATRCWWR